jgi:hypothetical protein
MATVTELSKAALDLLRHRLATRDNRVTTANMEAYRELVKAGIMFAVSGFVTGPEASFRFTDAGWQWVNDPANPYALQEESPVPGDSRLPIERFGVATSKILGMIRRI